MADAEIPEYQFEMRPGRPMRIRLGDRTLVTFMTGGWVKFAEDLTDDERKTFAWAVAIQKKLDHRGEIVNTIHKQTDYSERLRATADLLDGIGAMAREKEAE